MRNRSLCAVLAAVIGMLVEAATAAAQELEPKAYTASPVGGAIVRTGTNFRTVSAGWQWLWLTTR